MKNLIFLILVSVISVSCAPKANRIVIKDYRKTSVGVPIPLKYSSRKCLSTLRSSATASLPMTKLLSMGTKKLYILRDYNYSDIFSNTELGGTLSDYFENGVYIESLEGSQSLDNCFLQEESYEEDTYEDAAISILVPIREFKEKYSNILNGLSLRELTLKVAPLEPQGEGYLVNNAYYSGRKLEIVFLPQGSVDGSEVPFGGVPLWKFPMVSLHEYGHHIFRELVYTDADKDIAPDDSFHDNKLCFDNSMVDEEHNITSTKSSGVITKMTSLTAINEGFADLLAYYGYAPSRKIINMGCMTKSRDVEYGIFYNGDKKTLNKKNLKSFLNPTEMKVGACNVDTNYQDVHIIGAIYARAWYDVLSTLSLTDSKKIRILIFWLKNLNSSNHSISQPTELLAAGVEEMWDSLVQNGYGQRLDKCSVYKNYFPVLSPLECVE